LQADWHIRVTVLPTVLSGHKGMHDQVALSAKYPKEQEVETTHFLV